MVAGAEGNATFMAVPDNEFTSNPFLPGNVEDLMASGQFNPEIEIMIGTNSEEGILFVLGALLFHNEFEEFRDDFNISGPMYLFDRNLPSGLYLLIF